MTLWHISQQFTVVGVVKLASILYVMKRIMQWLKNWEAAKTDQPTDKKWTDRSEREYLEAVFIARSRF